MLDLLPSGATLAAFLAASFVLAVTPGPGVLYIVTRTLCQGRSAGLASVAGVALGNFGNAVAASLGLAALLALSLAAFTALKFAGAAYLVYLGVQALREPARTSAGEPGRPGAALARIFRDGFMVALLNPKTALFFAAFLPQFLQAQASPALEAMALGAVFVLIAALTDSAYVFLAGVLAPALSPGLAARCRYLVAGVYAGLGVFAALAKQGRPDG